MPNQTYSSLKWNLPRTDILIIVQLNHFIWLPIDDPERNACCINPVQNPMEQNNFSRKVASISELFYSTRPNILCSTSLIKYLCLISTCFVSIYVSLDRSFRTKLYQYYLSEMKLIVFMLISFTTLLSHTILLPASDRANYWAFRLLNATSFRKQLVTNIGALLYLISILVRLLRPLIDFALQLEPAWASSWSRTPGSVMFYIFNLPLRYHSRSACCATVIWFTSSVAICKPKILATTHTSGMVLVARYIGLLAMARHLMHTVSFWLKVTSQCPRHFA